MAKLTFIHSPAFGECNQRLGDAHKVFKTLYDQCGDASCFFEIFIESVNRRHLCLHNGKLAILSDFTDEGIGLRRISDRHADYVFVNSLAENALDSLIHMLRTSFSEKKLSSTGAIHHKRAETESSSFEKEISYLRKAHDKAWERNWRIESVTADWEEVCRSYRVINSEGTNVTNSDHRVSLSVQAAFGEGHETRQGFASQGGSVHQSGIPSIDPDTAACKTVDHAVEQDGAQSVPAGEYTVVLSAGACGIFVHEIIGHQLEADVYLNGLSCFSGMLGQRIAPRFITMIDDGTVQFGRGSSKTDDEGCPKQQTTLIENGILKNLLHDRLSASRMGLQQNGSARRENYSVMPLPRMSNTYLASGDADPGEMVRTVRKGLLITAVGQGQADPLTGRYMFNILSGFRIEDGKLTVPLRPFSIMGKSSETLNNIDAVAHDLVIGTGSGFCVKDAQKLPVSAGMPTVRIRNVVAGNL